MTSIASGLGCTKNAVAKRERKGGDEDQPLLSLADEFSERFDRLVP